MADESVVKAESAACRSHSCKLMNGRSETTVRYHRDLRSEALACQRVLHAMQKLLRNLLRQAQTNHIGEGVHSKLALAIRARFKTRRARKRSADRQPRPDGATPCRHCPSGQEASRHNPASAIGSPRGCRQQVSDAHGLAHRCRPRHLPCVTPKAADVLRSAA